MKPAPRRPRGCIFFFMALQLTAEHIRLQKMMMKSVANKLMHVAALPSQ
jgi:hypothetical protein